MERPKAASKIDELEIEGPEALLAIAYWVRPWWRYSAPIAALMSPAGSENSVPLPLMLRSSRFWLVWLRLLLSRSCVRTAAEVLAPPAAVEPNAPKRLSA